MSSVRHLRLYKSKSFYNLLNTVLNILPITDSTKTRLNYDLLEETKRPIVKAKQLASSSEINPFPLIKIKTSFKKFATSIVLPHSLNPTVSVIIPVYNQLEYTLRSLASIAKNFPNNNCEIIIIDDCSNDDTATILPLIEGLIIVTNNNNLNFLKSANRGAQQAKGEYLLFLNNDTEVQKGWLDTLKKVFEEHKDVGIVGSKIIYPSGHLQEAGAKIQADGSVIMTGLNDNPNRPQYNYLKEVDYCSGVSMMIKSSLFRAIGGFDEYFAPCYYEDADLAYRIKKLGKKIYYQPLSTICHHLSVSTTSGDSNEKIQNIEKNRHKFRKRWQKELESNQFTNEEKTSFINTQKELRKLNNQEHTKKNSPNYSDTYKSNAVATLACNIIGHIYAPSGRGEDVRTSALTAIAADLPFSLINTFGEYGKNGKGLSSKELENNKSSVIGKPDCVIPFPMKIIFL